MVSVRFVVEVIFGLGNPALYIVLLSNKVLLLLFFLRHGPRSSIHVLRRLSCHPEIAVMCVHLLPFLVGGLEVRLLSHQTFIWEVRACRLIHIDVIC